MVRWKACGVVFLCVCVFSKCASATGAHDTGSASHQSTAPIFRGAKNARSPRSADGDVTPQSSVYTKDFSCDKCFHGYCPGDKCLCPPGWKGAFCDGDINECETGEHRCHPKLGVCTNTIGSYKCRCKEGLEGDGFTCKAPLFHYVYNVSSPKRGDDIVYGPYPIYGGLAYLGRKYRNLYVSTNGYMSLDKKFKKANPFPGWQFPANIPIIAPYWTDLDLSSGPGALHIDVYSEINQTEEGTEIFSQFKNDVARWRNVSFSPSFLLVATWENARAYPDYLYNESESVSFQTVLATDSKQSFLLYDYGSGVMRWGRNVQWKDRRIILGFTDGFDQNYRVGTSSIYRPDLDTNIEVPGKYMYSLGAPITNHDMACIRWAFGDKPVDLTSPPQCPCDIPHMKIDIRYRRVRGSCYVMRSLDVDRSLSYKDKFAPCCYDSKTGVLLPAQIVLQSGDSRQRVDTFISPAYRPAYQACCNMSDLCHIFYKRYHDYGCDNYVSTISSMVSGYMTFKTWSRKTFSHPAFGQFVLADINNGSFVLQMRAGSPVTNLTASPNVTVPVAFAAEAFDSDRFEVRWTADGDAAIHVGGKAVGTMKFLPLGYQIWYKGVSLERLHGTEVNQTQDIVVYFNATQVALRIHQLLGRLSIIAVMQKSDDVEFRGVLNVPGEGNELHYTLRNGSISSHTNMMIDWEVREDESLFTYSIDTAINKDFVVPKLSFQKVVKKKEMPVSDYCWEDISCAAYLFAYVTLDDENFNWATHNEEDYYERLQFFVYANRAPVFDAERVIRVQAGKTLTLDFTELYDEDYDDYEVHLETNIQAGRYSYPEDEYDYKFVWTPTPRVADAALYLKFIAVDDYDLPRLYWPRLEVCACMDECSFDYLLTEQHSFSPEKFYLADCECRQGYKGRFCNETVNNICEPSPCYHEDYCYRSPQKPLHADCGLCPDGMSGDGVKCGASCHHGFHLLDNGTCADEDECDGDECTELGQYCVNTVGSFECKCRAEYVTSASGLACLFAPKRYYANLTFGVIKTAEGYVPYSSEMSDVGSELFKAVEENVARMITGVFEGLGLVAAHVAKITQSQSNKQAPLVHVKLYFLQEAQVDVERLESYIKKRHDKKYAEKLIDVSGLGVEGWDLCKHAEDNTCDVNTTTCTMTGGRFVCVCKDGFHNLSRDNSCQDVCSGNPCENGGKCLRKKHTYLCNCPEFWIGQHCTVKNAPAVRYRSAAIALGAAFGVMTAILLIALLAVAVRHVADRKRIRRSQRSFRSKRAKEDPLQDDVASIQVDVTCGQHQSPDGESDKSKDLEESPGQEGEENLACNIASFNPRRQNSRKIKGPCQTGETDAIDTQADI